MLFCQNCKTELNENSLFCHICGTKVETEIGDEKAASETTVSDENVEEPVKQTEPDYESYKVYGPLRDFSNSSKPLTLREKVMDFMDRFGKIIVVLLVLCGIISAIIIACSSSSSGSSSGSSSSYNSGGSDYKSGYSRDTLESIAASQLYIELSNTKSMGGVSLSTWYDLGSTRYSIGSIVEDNGVYIVRGTFSLYDYYGKIASNYYNETFTVRVSNSGYSCTTSIG